MDSAGGNTRHLPPRLGDPLVSLRYLIVGLLAYTVLFMLLGRFIPQHSNHVLRQIEDGFEILSLTVLFLAALLWPILLVLPFRGTDAFYLRAFDNDDRTGDLRLAIQRALGRGFRLSGIRDPWRRSSLFLRSVTVFVFCFRYSTVRYMNLEAGDDWLPRLWRSLGDARCVFIDMTELTGSVRAEVQVAHQRVGLSRILFLGGAGGDVETLRSCVSRTLALEETAFIRPHVAVWDPKPGPVRDRFHEGVREFAAQLPANQTGSLGVVATLLNGPPPFAAESMTRRIRLALTEFAGLAFFPTCFSYYQYGLWRVLAVLGGTPLSDREGRLIESYVRWFQWVVVALYVYACYSILRYFVECGSTIGRIKSIVILGFYSALFWLAATSK